MTIFDQVALPTAQQPAGGSLWDRIFGPIMPLLAGIWWIVLHLVVPFGLIVSLVWMIFAGFSGNRAGMARARSAMFAIPLGLFALFAAVAVSNWVIGNY